MSQERTLVVACPKCGQKNEFTVIDVLDSEKNPFEKEALLEGRLFDFKCGHCGDTMSLLYDFVYYDSHNDVEIFFCDREKVDGVYTALALMSGLEEHLDKCEYPTRRVECDYDHLCEKICIFENGFDDKVIELVKVFCLNDANEQIPDLNPYDAYFCMHEGVPSLELHGPNKVAIAPIPDGMYENLWDEFCDMIVDDEHVVVDLDWAVNLLNRSESEEEEVYSIAVEPDNGHWPDEMLEDEQEVSTNEDTDE